VVQNTAGDHPAVGYVEPMSDETTDPQDMAEALDSDKVGTPDDVEVEPEYPFDELLGADEYGTTPAEEQIGEPLSERIDREEPDPLVTELDHAAGPGTDDLADVERVGGNDVFGADGAIDGDDVGRLIESQDEDVDVLVDTEADAVARSAEQGDLSAEEMAVHLVDGPPGDPAADT
jgi:hypothetical protein